MKSVRETARKTNDDITGKEAANKRIEDDHGRACKQSREIRQLKDRLEETPRRHESRRRIENEEDQNEDCRHDAQRTRRCKEAVLKEIRQCQRVVRKLRIDAQARRNELPIRPCAERKSQRNPPGIEPCHIRKSG